MVLRNDAKPRNFSLNKSQPKKEIYLSVFFLFELPLSNFVFYQADDTLIGICNNLKATKKRASRKRCS